MLTCRQLTELMTDFAEGRLALAERLRFELHLGLCRDCRAYLHQLRLTAEAAGRLPEPELPRALEAELLRRFEGWKAKK
jgi:anti-sigma factor RsiW